MNPIKIVVSSKQNLQSKYDNHFSSIEKLLGKLIKADRKRGIETQIIYIDDPESVAKYNVAAVKSVTRPSAKKAIDELCKNIDPAYLVIFGSQDVFPFQQLSNPTTDEDPSIPSDLPYACDSSYGNKISSFLGPTRVVGRIPDIPGVADIDYIKFIIDNIINYKQVKAEDLTEYFAVTAEVWKKSTQQSLSNIFGNSTSLKISPSQNSPHSQIDLKPLIHFYNCHGAPTHSKYYGQKGQNQYPTAKHSPDLQGNVRRGTIVAAECCFGAELFNPIDEGTNNLSIANNYFNNGAIAFMGSSTIAYGPPSGNGLADLITQYFINNVINEASTGRALLEARQKFLAVCGPHLDPYEQKTIAQFYLLGDPSIHVVEKAQELSSTSTIENRRLNLLNKGLNLKATIAPSNLVEKVSPGDRNELNSEMKSVIEKVGFKGEEEVALFEVKTKSQKVSNFAKALGGGKNDITFRAYIQKPKQINKIISICDVLVFKESGDVMLGWKLYSKR